MGHANRQIGEEMDSQQARDALSKIMTAEKKYRVRFTVQGYIGESSRPYISFMTEPVKDVRNARVVLKTIIAGGARNAYIEREDDGVWREVMEERVSTTHESKE